MIRRAIAEELQPLKAALARVELQARSPCALRPANQARFTRARIKEGAGTRAHGSDPQDR